MKRDMELIRSLLLRIEASEAKPKLENIMKADEGEDRAKVSYHLHKLYEGGFIKGYATTTGNWVNLELTLDTSFWTRSATPPCGTRRKLALP